MEMPEGFIPENFVKDGVPDFDAFKADISAANAARSAIPEDFHKDGALDLDAFKSTFAELKEFKTTSDERRAALPQTAEDYVWRVPEGYELPEGFQLPEGTELAALANQEDEDLPALRDIMTKHELPQEVLDDLSRIMVGREIRSLMKASETAAAETEALGPDGRARVANIKTAISAKMPEPLAKAVLDGITSADALRGFEKLLGSKSFTTTQPGNQPDPSTMSARERIAAGLQQRKLING